MLPVNDRQRQKPCKSLIRKALEMGPRRFERPTSSLSGTRSNQLSYEPGSGLRGRKRDRDCMNGAAGVNGGPDAFRSSIRPMPPGVSAVYPTARGVPTGATRPSINNRHGLKSSLRPPLRTMIGKTNGTPKTASAVDRLILHIRGLGFVGSDLTTKGVPRILEGSRRFGRLGPGCSTPTRSSPAVCC